MSLSKYTGEPITTIGFTYDYDKLHKDYGTTIRMGTKGLNIGDYVLLKHGLWERKVRIISLINCPICNIQLEILKADVAPYPCETRADFMRILQHFYQFSILPDKMVWIIGWEVIKDV